MTANKTKTRIIVNVNDVFEEISDENKRLKKLVNFLIEFKEFCDSIVSQLNPNDIKRYQDLEKKFNELKNCELKDVSHQPKTTPIPDNERSTLKRRLRYERISNDMRLLIIKMLDNGIKPNAVSDKCGVDVNTIRSIYRRYQMTGVAINRSTIDLRPKVLTKEQEEVIRQWYKDEPSLTLQDLRDKCLEKWPNIKDITTDTIRRCFTEINARPDTQIHSDFSLKDIADKEAEPSTAIQAIDDQNTEIQVNESAEGEEQMVKQSGEQLSNEVLNDSEVTESADNSDTNDNGLKKTRKKRKNTPSLNNQEIKMLDNGSKRAKVAKKLGHKESTIAAIHRKYKETGSVQLKLKHNRKRCLTEEQVNQLQQWFKDDPSLTAEELRHKALQKWPNVENISTMTVYRYLGETYRTVKRIKKSKRAVDDSQHVCPICDKQFQYKATMHKHIETHNPADSYTCDQCPFGAKTNASLRNHIETMHEPRDRPFKCHFEGCGKDFRISYALKAHIAAIHVPPETVRCTHDGCDRVLKNSRVLKSHLENYHGEATVCCEWPGCDYKTTSRYKLPIHRLVHTSERKFVCQWTQCGKQFKTTTHLKNHQRIHTNDRKYVCLWPGCNYSCVFGGNLNKHMRVHQK